MQQDLGASQLVLDIMGCSDMAAYWQTEQPSTRTQGIHQPQQQQQPPLGLAAHILALIFAMMRHCTCTRDMHDMDLPK